MNESKRPYVFFGIYTVIIQIVMWIMFCLYDYGIDEMHWETLADLEFSEYLPFLILPVPIVSYIILNKKFFSDGSPIKETVFQIICWAAVSAAISYPIVHSVNYGTWIIDQDAYSGGLIDMDGLEYLLMPIFEVMLAAALLIKLIVHIALHMRNKAKG